MDHDNRRASPFVSEAILVNAQDLERILVRMEEQLRNHIVRYDRDREETKDRYSEERQERDEWRGKIDEKIDKLDEKIQPVVNDHQIIVVGGKWFLGVIGALWAFIKAWLFVSDRLK